MVRIAILSAALLVLATVSASAGITTGENGNDSAFGSLAGDASAAGLSGSLDAALNGPHVKEGGAPQPSAAYEEITSNAKSLQSFSRGSSKHGDWDWWDDWDWDWDHDWPGQGTVVPEPASMLLLGAGLGVLGLRRRFSKK